jgi:hypothetical protein
MQPSLLVPLACLFDGDHAWPFPESR